MYIVFINYFETKLRTYSLNIEIFYKFTERYQILFKLSYFCVFYSIPKGFGPLATVNSIIEASATREPLLKGLDEGRIRSFDHIP